MRKVFTKSVLMSVIALHFNANATTSGNSLSEIETIVTTANRAEQSHLKLIGNTSVIAKDAIESVNAEHLNQLLSLASGVWLSRGNGQESLLSVRSPVLTGAGSCAEFLTLENNISLRAPGFCNVNQLFDSHFEASDNIEVVKGNNSARYGSNAIHGIINLTNTLYDKPTSASLDIGSDDFYRLNGSISQDYHDVSFGAAATITSDGGFQESSGYQQQKLSVGAKHNLGSWQSIHHFTITNLSQDTAGYLQQGENAYKDKSLLKINAFPDAYRDSLSLRYSMNNMLELDDTRWEITPYLRYNQMEFLMHFLPGTPVEENDQKSLGVQINRLSNINDRLSLKIGSDIDLTKGSLLQYQTAETESNSAFLRAVLPQGKHYDYSVFGQNYALFSQLDMTLADNQNAFIAVRYDVTQYKYTNHMASGNLKEDGTACGFGGCRYTRPDDQRTTFNDFSFSLGYSYAIDDNLIIFTKADNSFRAPHTAELYRLQNNQQNIDINSVDANQLEIGMRYMNGDLFAEVNIYHLEKQNAIYQDADRHYLNGLETRHRGIELDLNWQIHPLLKARLNTSYAKHTYENNPQNGATIKGNEIDTSPRLMANMQFDWQVSNSVNTQLEVRHLDGYYLDAQNTQQYAGHTVSNLRTYWEINDAISLSLAILNLFDSRYAERADYAFGNNRYFIGEPRNYSAQLKYQF